MTKLIKITLFAGVLALGAGACSSKSSNNDSGGTGGAGGGTGGAGGGTGGTGGGTGGTGGGTGGSGGSDGGAPDANDCVMNPVTHVDFLNACTTSDVVKIKKTPTLPLLLPDGGLPPLP